MRLHNPIILGKVDLREEMGSHGGVRNILVFITCCSIACSSGAVGRENETHAHPPSDVEINRGSFPAGFIFGVASSAYQVNEFIRASSPWMHVISVALPISAKDWSDELDLLVLWESSIDNRKANRGLMRACLHHFRDMNEWSTLLSLEMRFNSIY